MKLITRLFRIIRINFILARYNIDEIILGTHWFHPIRFFVFFNPYYWTSVRKLPRGERIRLAIESLGPIFVKAGQLLSTRRDIIPDDIATELAKLQDRVPPFSGQKAKAIVEAALKAKLEDVFLNFDTNALASASIAQVHAATLLDNQSVVVKVLRPHIDSIIARDVDLLMAMAKFAERYLANAHYFKPRQIINEIAQTFEDELDLTREGANASQLRRNLADSDIIYIPKIHWDYCHTNILVMERIHGVPVHNIERLRQLGVNMQVLAERALEIFIMQIFRDSFFHADLHPGNLFVNCEDPKQPTFIAVDFGIVGSLSQSDKRYLAENMIAFFNRDYQRVAELHIACGWLPPDTRIDQFEGAIRAVSEPIFERPLRDISFGQLLLKLFQVARQYHINIQPQLILLQKTLLSIEGLCRQLTPELDMWTNATPKIEKWLKKQVGVKAFLKRIKENLPLWSEQLPDLPMLVYEVLQETKHQQERLRFKQQVEAANKVEKKRSGLFYVFIGAGLTLIGVGVYLYFYS